MSAPATFSPAELSRYSRHILLDEIGVEGQRRLASAKVLVIGAGGLGSPVALYLAAAGIGTLGITDLDRVEDHNLQRQLLHDTTSVGESKVVSAARRLRGLNPHIVVREHPEGITPENVQSIFEGYDIVVDGTDNFSARYINNDAAVALRKPLVFGSIFKFEGQATVFDSARGGPCYRCMFPEPPAPGSVPGCGEAGVIGALCGVIGSIQALETVKLITGIGESLVGRLLTYDALSQRLQEFSLRRNPECSCCGTGVKSAATANTAPSPRSSSSMEYPLEMSVAEAHERLKTAGANVMLIDVREPWETDICRVPGAEFIPMRQIPERLDSLPRDRHLLIMCHHGARSQRVTQFLRNNGFDTVTNVSGGIAAWTDEIDPSLQRY